MEQFLSILALLAILVGTLYLSWWVSKKLAVGVHSGGKGGYLRVVDRVQTGRDTAVVILAVQTEHYLVGVADKSVTLLGRLEQLETLPAQAESASDKSKAFHTLLAQIPILRRMDQE